MLEAGGILIIMCSIFFIGALSQGILSIFYTRYLKDASDMEKPGKKLMKLSKLRYETSYYLNGTVHNAKSMVHSMMEHYRLAGMRLWTWQHIGTAAECICGAAGLAIGGSYILGMYIPAVRNVIPLGGKTALVHVLVGMSCVVMLGIWQQVLDNQGKRKRLELAMVDYFDNNKYHQLSREIALSGRVREIVGNRGRTEDPGSAMAAGRLASGMAAMSGVSGTAGVSGTSGMNGTEGRNGGIGGANMSGTAKEASFADSETEREAASTETLEKSEKKGRTSRKKSVGSVKAEKSAENMTKSDDSPANAIMEPETNMEKVRVSETEETKEAVKEEVLPKKTPGKTVKRRTTAARKISGDVIVSMNRDSSEIRKADEKETDAFSVEKTSGRAGESEAAATGIGADAGARKKSAAGAGRESAETRTAPVTEKEEQLLSLLREYLDMQ